MIQVTATMRILVAIEPVDLRKGIDVYAVLPRETGNRPFLRVPVHFSQPTRHYDKKALAFDGQGYWMAQKRLSKGRFKWWPEASSPAVTEAYEAQLLMAFLGDVSRVRAAPMWRRVNG